MSRTTVGIDRTFDGENSKMFDNAEITGDDVEKWILAETARLEFEHAAFVQLGRGLDFSQLLQYDGADFVRVAYGMVFDRAPTSGELIVDSILLKRGFSKLELIRKLRFCPNGPRHSKPGHRYRLWMLQLRHVLAGEHDSLEPSRLGRPSDCVALSPALISPTRP